MNLAKDFHILSCYNFRFECILLQFRQNRLRQKSESFTGIHKRSVLHCISHSGSRVNKVCLKCTQNVFVSLHKSRLFCADIYYKMTVEYKLRLEYMKNLIK